MNDLSRAPYALLLFASFSLAACSGGAPGSDGSSAEQPPLAGAAMGGPFALTSETGATVRDGDFAGQYRIIYFGYTYCPDVCPLDMQKLGQAMRALEARDPDLAARIQPIFISIDPARDTPAVLAEFTDHFHPRLLGLTGTPEQLEQVVREYGSYAEIPDNPGGDNYLVAHRNDVVMYGPAGEPIVNLDMAAPPAVIAEEIERWAS